VASKPPSVLRLIRDAFARPESHPYGSHKIQRADLYLPAGEGPHKVAIVIHGGSWQAVYGRWVMRLVAADLVRRGWAVWNIGYRRLGRGEGGGWPATFDDVAAAVDALAGAAEDRDDLDVGDITLIGHSAGGQLALWAASRADSAVVVGRVVALAAVCEMARTQIARNVLGGSPAEVPERYDAVDPIRLLPLSMPTLLVHGAGDRIVPVEHSRDYTAAARAAGCDAELIEPPDTGHRAFVDPRSEGWRAAAEWILPEWTSTESPSTPSGPSST
jgi:acetyl esterase/lipase